jgi:succinyl-CoA synthetase alpha subunit
MSILVDESSRVIIQGITGRIGKVFSARMAKHYVNTFCGGVRPGLRGEMNDRKIFPSVADAVKEAGANTSIIVVPGPAVKSAVFEAVEAGIKLIWIYTDGVPVHDAIYFINYARLNGTRIIGPNAVGVVSPGKASASELNEDTLPMKPGRIGIVSKSGSLSYEVIDILAEAKEGLSSVLCIGGDLVCGTSYCDALTFFANDAQTEAIVMLGEIGGTAEIEGAKTLSSIRKPVIAYIAGWQAPKGKKMGHASAIVNRDQDTAVAKSAFLEKHGVRVAASLAGLAALIEKNA